MRLPNADRAVVAQEKITGYLLSLSSPDGASKARFFYLFGFRREQWQVLAQALRELCLQYEVAEVLEKEYGTQHVIIGQITSPDGRNPLVKTVWQFDHGVEVPRLITAYPPD
ncbi:MAG: hypothetical protein OXI91_12065 [Chloroflexota bacterium]|nr:hypothetical protein [Chloroflexota bacterium]